MRLIISGICGTDNPTMATLPFMAAKTVQEQGQDVVLFLWNEAVTLARPGIGDHVTGVNLPPLREIITGIVTTSIPNMSECSRCSSNNKNPEWVADKHS